MKNYLAVLLSFVFALAMVAQEEQVHMVDIAEVNVNPPKFLVLEHPYNLVEGDVHTYVIDQFKGTDIKMDRCLGTSIISFVVNTNGELENFKVVNSVTPEVDQEVMRILASTDGMWRPGMNNGSPVNMEQEISLQIKIGDFNASSECNFVELAQRRFAKGNMLLMEKDRTRRALNQYTEGIRLLPNDQSLLMARGLCYYELGKYDEARTDWERLRSLGGVDMFDGEILAQFKNLEGYQMMSQILGDE